MQICMDKGIDIGILRFSKNKFLVIQNLLKSGRNYWAACSYAHLFACSSARSIACLALLALLARSAALSRSRARLTVKYFCPIL